MKQKISMQRMWIILSLCAAAALCTSAAGVPHQAATTIEGPDAALLDGLSNIYEGVMFDHELHASYASCAECHHHVAGLPSADTACNSCHRRGTSASVLDCKSCHLSDRFSQQTLSEKKNQTGYHIDIIGLLGAYHMNCLGCHLSLTAGPTGCLDCHRRKGPAPPPPARVVGQEERRAR